MRLPCAQRLCSGQLGRVRRELHFRHRDAETDSTSAPGIRRGDRRLGGAPEEVASLGDLVCSPICQLTSFSSRWLIYSSTAAAIRPGLVCISPYRHDNYEAITEIYRSSERAPTVRVTPIDLYIFLRRPLGELNDRT